MTDLLLWKLETPQDRIRISYRHGIDQTRDRRGEDAHWSILAYWTKWNIPSPPHHNRIMALRNGTNFFITGRERKPGCLL
ncbi:MAG: hypothetical protein HC884_09310 [Chloroflexaceae bacterium]|nr:hypothetical protein [Chloroflexaceae bacterium]